MKYSMNTNSIRKQYSIGEIVRIAQAAGVQGLEWGLGPLEQAESDISRSVTPHSARRRR